MVIATKLLNYINKAKIAEYRVIKTLGLASENSLRVTLSRLMKKNLIISPYKGIYVSRDADPFFVAATIVPGYLSLSTALYLHHLIDEYPFTIFIASERNAAMRLGEHELKYFRAKNYLSVIQGPYPFASVEKAIYDCLIRPELVGYHKIAKALAEAKLHSGHFISLCRKEDSAFFQRLGYILSLLPAPDSQKRSLLGYCKRRVRSNIYLQGRKKGVYIREWKLIDNVGQKVILSWWEQ